MSQQEPSTSETASHSHGAATPPLGNLVFLDEVDIGEQVKIHTRLSRHLESSFDLAIKEAIRRSLLLCPSECLQTDSAVAENSSDMASAQPPASAADTGTDINGASSQADSGTGDNGPTQIGATAAFPLSGVQQNSMGSSGDQSASLRMAAVDSDTQVNGMPDIGAMDLNDADDENDEDVPRSRRGRYQHQRQVQSEWRPSLDRMNQQMSERRPSLDRMNQQMSERRPSLDRMNSHGSDRRPSLDRTHQYQSERRPSLDRRDNYASERRPSLERLNNNNRSERRPSLERQNEYRSERRPSLDMLERRPSLERRNGQQGERRPSLDRMDRQAGLEGLQGGGESLQSLSSPDSGTGPAQGINTLRPWPLSETGIPTNWDVAQLPKDGGSLYCLVPLSPIDQEYSAITVDFEEAGLKVINVERLQNSMLLERFNHEKEHLLKLRPPDFVLNERYLYHGTQANKQRLCEEGLDHRLSFQGCFGRGIYFSDNPRKCMQYATTGSNNLDNSNSTHPMILVCRVLLGESKKYDHGIKDSNLKREPEKPKAKGGWRYYDSVQGIPVDYPEFVVYDNRRSMIEYIVTFEEVAYRAPPAVSKFYPDPMPSLYKVEPIVLPIPEEELDKMYMLCPDTDSDGSCDEHTREVEQLRDNVKRAKAKRLGIPYRPPTKEEKRFERLHWKRVCYYSCPPGSPLFEMMILKKTQEKADRKKRKAAARAKKAAAEAKKAEPGAEDEALGAVGGSTSSTTTTTATTTTTSANTGVTTSASSSDTARTTVTSSAADSAEPDYEVENDSVAEVLSTLIADFLNVASMDDVAKARRYLLDNSMDLDQALCQFFRDLE